MPVHEKKDMIRRKFIRRKLSVDRDPAFVNRLPLAHGYDRGAGADRVYGAERCDGGDPKIRGGIGRHFFYADDFYCDAIPWFECGRFDVQTAVEAGTPLVLVTKTGVGIEKAAEKNEKQEEDTSFFRRKMSHRECLFYYVMQNECQGVADRKPK